VDSASVLACEGRGVVQNSELGGRGGEGARVEQVLEQDVARVLDSDRAGLEHAEPRLTIGDVRLMRTSEFIRCEADAGRVWLHGVPIYARLHEEDQGSRVEEVEGVD
jgi:hypothetical protein